MSSVSSVSSASSSSSSVRSADSEDMYADLASPVSSASSRSPTPAQQKKGTGTCSGGVLFLLRSVLEKKGGAEILPPGMFWAPGESLSRAGAQRSRQAVEEIKSPCPSIPVPLVFSSLFLPGTSASPSSHSPSPLEGDINLDNSVSPSLPLLVPDRSRICGKSLLFFVVSVPLCGNAGFLNP